MGNRFEGIGEGKAGGNRRLSVIRAVKMGFKESGSLNWI